MRAGVFQAVRNIQAMTVEELKIEVAQLSSEDQLALAAWLQQDNEVQVLLRKNLITEIQLGIEQADGGELLEADEVFDRLRVM